MISFKRPEDVVPSCLILLSILILAGTLAYMLLVPKPSAAGSTALSARSRRRLVSDIAATKKQGQQAEAAVRPRLWHSDPQSVTAMALAQMTDLAGKHLVKLTAFRPARSQSFDSMTELRFEAQLSGPYAGIHAVMAALDARGSKVVLRGVQIASSQEAGNGVTATLGLSAFVAADPDLAPVPAAPAKKGAAHG